MRFYMLNFVSIVILSFIFIFFSFSCGLDTDLPWSKDTATTTTTASTWSTYVFNAGDATASGSSENDRAVEVFVDSSNYIWLVGAIHESGHFTWHVRKSTNGGQTFSAVDTFTPLSSTKNSIARFIVQDSSGNIFIGGSSEDSSGISHWIVQKGTFSSGQFSWSTLDDYRMYTYYSSQAYAATFDSSGNLFVVGKGGYSTSKNAINVRKLVKDQTSFSTVESYYNPSNSYYYCTGRTIVADSSDNIYAGGDCSISTEETSSRAIVLRKGANGGSTWTSSLDFYQFADNDVLQTRSYLNSLVSNNGSSSASTYPLIAAWNSGHLSNWGYLTKYTNSSSSWGMFKGGDLGVSSISSSNIHKLFIHRDYLYYAGANKMIGQDNGYGWFIMRSESADPTCVSMITYDYNYQYTNNVPTIASDITVHTATNKVYVSGYTYANSQLHWILRSRTLVSW